MRPLVDRARFPSHPFTRQSSPAPSSIRRGPVCRATRGASERLAALLRDRGKMRLTSLCKPTCHHEHSRTSLDFLRSPAGSRRRARPGERPARGRNLKLGPSRRRSEEALDGAPSASVSPGSQPSPKRGSRAARCRAPRREVRVGAPPGRRFRPSERRGGAASDALCRSRPRWGFRLPSARGGPSFRTGPPGSQDRCLRSSRQRGRRTSTQRAFPPVARTLGDPLARALSGAVRRLLAIETIHEHDRWNPPEPFPVARGCPRAPGRGGCALANAAGRRFTAQGAGSGSRRIGLVQAMPGRATPKPIPAEHLAS